MSCPTGLTFDLAPDAGRELHPPARELAGALEAVPARYQPRCLQTCEMAGFCRDEARTAGALTVLGLGRPRRSRRPGHDQHRARAGQRQPRSPPPIRPTSRVRCATPRTLSDSLAGGAA